MTSAGKSPSPLRWLLMTYGIFIALIVLTGIMARSYTYRHPTTTYQETLLPITAPQTAETTIEVGLLIDNVYVLEADKKTFDADGSVWLKWSPALETKMKALGMGPEDLFQFFNQIDDWDSILKPQSETPMPLPDGRLYQRFRFSGHFYANQLDFRLYPFQTIKLPMAIELTNDKLMGPGKTLGIQLDQAHSGLGAYVDLGGYLTRGFTFNAYFHEYENSLGEPNLPEGPRKIPQARMEIAYQKAPLATGIKILLPLITVMALTLFSPSIASAGWDVRLGIPPTALLTLIFLQQTYQSWLPELAYITFLDTIYNVCYLANLILFGLFLWGTNEYSGASEEEKPAVSLRIDRIDRIFQIGLSVVIVFMIWGNWYLLSRHTA